MNIDHIIDKIRKLLALSTSSNEHEAASAAAKAAQLMAEYQLEDAQLRVEDKEGHEAEPIVQEQIDTAGRIIHWRGSIASALAKSLGCHSWYSGSNIKLFGRPSAIRTVSYMFQYLTSEVERLACEAWNNNEPNITYDSARRWKNAFRIGAATTISNRLREQRKQQETARDIAKAAGGEGSQALVLLKREDAEVETAYKVLSARFRKVNGPAITSRGGYAAGQAAGANVSLSTGARLGAAPNKITGI